MASTSTLRVLSLDGGGVRGYSSLIILRRVMREIQRRDNLPSLPKPCDHFDVIAGTSTGGLIAIMLGRLRMDVDSCILQYEKLSQDIFKTGFQLPGKMAWDAWRGNPWFSGDDLANAIKKVVENNLSPEEKTELKSHNKALSEAGLFDPGKQICKTFCVAIKKETNETVRFRTYATKDGDTDSCAIWEAARATSAAPIYFPPIKVTTGGVENEYFDGGMTSNNPIIRVKDEVEEELNTPQPRCVVSIGTGKVDKATGERTFLQRFGKWVTGGFGMVGWTLLTLATDTEAKHLEIMNDDNNREFRKNYYRFNVEGNIGSIGLDEWKKLPELRRATDEYIDSPNIRDTIIQCSQKL